ncbi:MAG: FtsX-like permease family protein [Treponema sp.]|jgi:ABC-type lipoprotein release transport system permease subunit|nr:FtsX-like permease family protein [Treponema sp.]
MIVLLVFRNIVRNKKNSLIIVLLITVITFLFFIGNSLIGRSERSLREAFVDSLTGDAVIQKSGDIIMNLFGANTPVINEYFTIPMLPAYDAVMEVIREEPGITGITSQVSCSVYLDLGGVREPALLAGVDADTYFSFFEGIRLEEGRFPVSGEYGGIITSERADRIAEKTGTRPAAGDPMLFTSAGKTGFKLREIPLIGIFSYRNPGQFMNEVILADPQTVRVLASIQVASSDVAVGEEALDLLDVSVDRLFEEDLFGDGFSGDGAENAGIAAGSEEGRADGAFSAGALMSFLGASKGESAPLVGGDWNFIILKFRRGISASAVIGSLNKKLAPYGVRAVNWRMAAGTSAIIMLMVQALFNSGMFLVSVAGIIAAANILLIAVFRRTREIGTLRAMGAEDAYIRGLILGENGLLAAAAGILGIFAGLVFIRFINFLDPHIPNALIASLLGGETVNLVFIPGMAAFSLAAAVALGFAASLYPVETAVRIDPVEAVRQG